MPAARHLYIHVADAACVGSIKATSSQVPMLEEISVPSDIAENEGSVALSFGGALPTPHDNEGQRSKRRTTDGLAPCCRPSIASEH